jgi:hypothetical protein
VLGAVTYEYDAKVGDGLKQLQGDALRLCTLIVPEDEWVMSWADYGIDAARAGSEAWAGSGTRPVMGATSCRGRGGKGGWATRGGIIDAERQ